MWVKSKRLILDKMMSQELPATVNRVNYDIWHKRMGHPSLEILKKGPTNLKGFPDDLIYKSKELICPGCALGKMKNRSYPQSTKRATKTFELIHVDLLTMPIESYHKYKYFMVILDDYSSAVWGFLLKNKGITHQRTSPHEHQQNGCAECIN